MKIWDLVHCLNMDKFPICDYAIISSISILFVHTVAPARVYEWVARDEKPISSQLILCREVCEMSMFCAGIANFISYGEEEGLI